MRPFSSSLAILAVTATGALFAPCLAFGYTLASPTKAAPLPSLAAIEACPYDKLKAAYDAAMTGADTLDVFAIDKEILTVCNERTALIVKLKKGDAELAKLLAPPKPVVTAKAAPKSKAEAPVKVAAATPVPATPIIAATSASKTPVLSAPGTASGPAAPSSSDAAPVACTAKYAMISLAAVPGQRAYSIGGVVDQASGATYTVKVGDTLPGGYRVEAVDQRGITLRHAGSSEILPPNTKSYPQPAEGFYGRPVRTDAAGSIPTLKHG